MRQWPSEVPRLLALTNARPCRSNNNWTQACAPSIFASSMTGKGFANLTSIMVIITKIATGITLFRRSSSGFAETRLNSSLCLPSTKMPQGACLPEKCLTDALPMPGSDQVRRKNACLPFAALKYHPSASNAPAHRMLAGGMALTATVQHILIRRRAATGDTALLRAMKISHSNSTASAPRPLHRCNCMITCRRGPSHLSGDGKEDHLPSTRMELSIIGT